MISVYGEYYYPGRTDAPPEIVDKNLPVIMPDTWKKRENKHFFRQLKGDTSMDKLKVILIFVGIVIMLGFLASFLQSRSPLELFYMTIAMMVIIFGFYIEGDKVNETFTYFVAMFCVNIFQWLILIYIFFISRVYVTEDFFYYLVGALLFTIALIIQIRRSDLKYLGNSQRTNKDVILADKIKLMLMDKTKVILIFVGIVIMLGCLASFFQSRSPLALFGSSIGMMAIIYGFYRENKRVNVTVNYFWAMSCVNIFQWLILIYVFFIRQVRVDDEVFQAFTFTFFFTVFFFIQIRESDLKYIGKMRK